MQYLSCIGTGKEWGDVGGFVVGGCRSFFLWDGEEDGAVRIEEFFVCEEWVGGVDRNVAAGVESRNLFATGAKLDFFFGVRLLAFYAEGKTVVG